MAILVAASQQVPLSPPVQLPVPVQDTPEVAAAKQSHAVQWLNAKAANDAANLRNLGVIPIGSPLGAQVIGAPLPAPMGATVIDGRLGGGSLIGSPLGVSPLSTSWGYNTVAPLGNPWGMPLGMIPSNMGGQRLVVV